MRDAEYQKQLVQGLAEKLTTLNKKNDESEIYLFESDITPTDIPGYVSSGSDLLDIVMTNRRNGGFPFGKIIELQGLEGSGKSLIGSHALANVQKMGGIAVYIDSEAAVNREFLQVLGVALDQLIYISTDTVESAFQNIEDIVTTIRNDDADIPVVILVDSVSALKTRAEAETDYGTDGYATHKARIMGKAMRKLNVMLARQKICVIFTSQLRMQLGVSFGDKWCVDPYTTNIKIRYDAPNSNESIKEEVTIAEFSERFLGITDFENPEEYDLHGMNIEILGFDNETQRQTYSLINKFIVKSPVNKYYSDGILNGSAEHRIIENNKNIFLKDHSDFKVINEPLKIVDFDINKTHNYYANGRLNHNTTSGGKALGFHASIRIRLANSGKIKLTSSKDVIGTNIKAKIIKNRLAPPFKVAEFPLYFTSGINNTQSYLPLIKDLGLISGRSIVFKDTKIPFVQATFSDTVLNTPGLKDYLYEEICKELIVKYVKPEEINLDDVEVSDGPLEEC
jgi:RecA/RadA recombinase